LDQEESQPFLHGSDQPPGLTIGHPRLFRRPMERMSLFNSLQEFTGAVSESLPIIIQPNFITDLQLLIKDRYSLLRITPI
jgi:hypothetical protein